MRNFIRAIPPPLTAVIALGIGNQLGQVLLLRELLMLFHGNELTLGIILAFWVIWEAVGCWAGALTADRTSNPTRAMALLVAGAVFVMPATIILVRLSRGFFDTVPGTHLSLYHTALSCFLLLAPICTLMGAQFVLLARLWREHRLADDMSGAARTYVAEAAGHMSGGLLFSLCLVHLLAPLQVSAIMGIIMTAGILPLLKSRPATRRALAGMLFLTAILLPFIHIPGRWAYGAQWRRLIPDSRLIETRESKYGTINVAARRGQYSFFQSNHLVFSTGGPQDKLTGMEEIEAAQLAHLAVSQHSMPRSALLIGGGMRGMLREMLRYSDLSIDYVELDSTLIDVAEPYLPQSTRKALRDPRAKVLTTDGRRHLKTTDSTYDLIIIDLPDPATAVLNRFYTREFFLEAGDRLAPGGVLAIALTSTPGLRDRAIVNRNSTLYHTLRDIFADVMVAGEDICLFFASEIPGTITPNAQTLGDRHERRGVESPAFSRRHFHTLLQDSVVRRKNWILRNHGRRPGAAYEPPDTGPIFPGTLEEQKEEEAGLEPVDRRFFINSDFRPIGYFHTLILLDRIAGGGLHDILSAMLRIRLWWTAPLAAALAAAALLLRVIVRKRGGHKDLNYAVGFSVFAIGFSSMVFELTLIFAFQSIYGHVFEQIGLIVALFMGGLALGGGLSERLSTGKIKTFHTMFFLQAGFVLFALAAAAGLPAAAALRSPALVFALFAFATLTAGMLNGAHYPVAAACRHAAEGRAELSAGFVYAIELAGACTGAVLAGVALLPVLGLPATCIAAGTLNATALVILWIVAKKGIFN